MDLSAAEFLGISLGVGFFAGVANFLAGLVSDTIVGVRQTKAQKRELNHQATSQTRAEQHQDTSQQKDLDHKREMQREDLAHQRAMQEAQLEHDQEVRRESDFYAARDRLLPTAIQLEEWADFEYEKHFGERYDFYAITDPPTVATPAQAIRLLSSFRLHPQPVVREFADRLRMSIHSAHGTPDSDGELRIAESGYERWVDDTKTLREALHSPNQQMPIAP